MRSAWLLGVALLVCSCSKAPPEPANDYKPAEAPPLPPGPDKLEKVDEKIGDGPEAKTGDKVKVHYTGTLMNGKEFDSSRGPGKQPFSFEIGKGMVIKGWDEGVPGMKVGGKRKLTIPYSLAYGEAGSGDKIPPKAGLKFDIELLEIEGAGGGAADGGAKPAASASAKPAASAKK